MISLRNRESSTWKKMNLFTFILRFCVRSSIYLLLSAIFNFSLAHPIASERTTDLNNPLTVRIFEDDFISEGSLCTRGGPFDYPKCAPGTWCIGKQILKCTKLRKPGQSCGNEFEKCSRGSFCNDANLCEKAPAMDTHYVKLEGDCVESKPPNCKPGLWCILGKCRKLVPCGKPCGEEWQRCRPGLTCRTIYPTKQKVCTRYFGFLEVLQEGERCAKDAARKCNTGLRCVKVSPGKHECAIPKRLGEPCQRGSGMCEFGRVCTETKYSKVQICVEPKDIGEHCDERYALCKKNMRCEKIGTISRCVAGILATLEPEE